ncbi:MAG TPA: glycosyl hydrolase family 79 C-terminal domain-containing protein [Solirubrobacteraceae bacterium]|nr:glycosyl hydrolase family 79 C-terminal domain-containing protein [Solirubrobacteraceae bacterium]
MSDGIPRSLRACRLLLLVPLALAVCVAFAPLGRARERGAIRPRGPIVLAVGGPTGAPAIAPGFLGLSLEYWALPGYAGSNPSAVDPVFVQLIRNLAGRYPPQLRIGGYTTDITWRPRPGLGRPAGASYALTRRWIAVARSLAATLGARLILGINLEADSPAVAATEADALVRGIGRERVEALELGNEPELYGIFNWGVSNATGRPPGYGFGDFENDFARIARALPDVPLAGPSLAGGAIGTSGWFQYLGRFLSDQPRVAVATVHRYPLQQCYVSPTQPDYPTIANLLAPAASRALAASVAGVVKTAHAHRVPVRIDEMNTDSCGLVPSVTDSFASALWALDALFSMAGVGVDGVNIHTYPLAGASLFGFHRVQRRWRATVQPEYYGLQMFAQAAPAGSRLLRVSPAGTAHLEVWATRALDHTIRIVVINESSRARTVELRLRATVAAGTLERLEAPSLSARRGVTLGGQSFGTSTPTGLLAGPVRTSAVAWSARGYVFRVAAGSAAMLTLPPG